MTCPNCGREVETGFRFCDGCGTRLPEAGESSTSPEAPSGPPPPSPPPKTPPRDTSSTVEHDRPVPPPPPPSPPTEETEAGRRVGIGGWLRRSETPPGEVGGSTPTEPQQAEPTVPVPAPPPPPPPRPASEAAAALSGPSLGGVPWFVVHVVVAFVAGVVLVGVAAAVSTLATDGSFALLDVRGLPVFLGVATSILVLALLRGRSRSTDPRRDWVLVAIGFIALVGAGIFVYSPMVLERARAELDRGLGVWGEADEAAVRDFRGSIVSWNQHVTRLDRAGREIDDPGEGATFRGALAEAEQGMARSLGAMHAAVATADNSELADALRTLTGAYEGQLAGIRSVIEGIDESDLPKIEAGNDAYREARGEVLAIFTEHLRPVLERGELDPEAFARAISS